MSILGNVLDELEGTTNSLGLEGLDDNAILLEMGNEPVSAEMLEAELLHVATILSEIEVVNLTAANNLAKAHGTIHQATAMVTTLEQLNGRIDEVAVADYNLATRGVVLTQLRDATRGLPAAFLIDEGLESISDAHNILDALEASHMVGVEAADEGDDKPAEEPKKDEGEKAKDDKEGDDAKVDDKGMVSKAIEAVKKFVMRIVNAVIDRVKRIGSGGAATAAALNKAVAKFNERLSASGASLKVDTSKEVAAEGAYKYITDDAGAINVGKLINLVRAWGANVSKKDMHAAAQKVVSKIESWEPGTDIAPLDTEARAMILKVVKGTSQSTLPAEGKDVTYPMFGMYSMKVANQAKRYNITITAKEDYKSKAAKASSAQDCKRYLAALTGIANTLDGSYDGMTKILGMLSSGKAFASGKFKKEVSADAAASLKAAALTVSDAMSAKVNLDAALGGAGKELARHIAASLGTSSGTDDKPKDGDDDKAKADDTQTDDPKKGEDDK